MKKKFDPVNAIRLSIVGVGLFVVAYSSFRIIWTSQSDLITLKGKIQGAEIYNSVTYDRHDREERTEILVFYLTNYEKKFIISKDLKEDQYYTDETIDLKKQLKHSDSVIVSIKKEEQNKYEPKVYQLKIDNHIAISLEDTISAEQIPFIILTVFGTILILLAYYLFKKKKNFLLDDEESERLFSDNPPPNQPN